MPGGWSGALGGVRKREEGAALHPPGTHPWTLLVDLFGERGFYFLTDIRITVTVFNSIDYFTKLTAFRTVFIEKIIRPG